jgi:ketopantoate reductase
LIEIIDSKTAAVTSSAALPDTDPSVAVMALEPTATAVASPEEALIVATAGVSEAQATFAVKSAVLVSLKVPVAVNCCVNPLAMLGAAGVTAIDTKPLTKETRAVLVPPLNK